MKMGLFGFGKSEPKSETRKFKCDCGANSWIVNNVSHYDEKTASGSYNYKEWLTCAKCGKTETNEKRI
jgi:hypothetical protein